jgi:hypothetical protein
MGMDMKDGAFALLDCLGFKGLWKDDHSALMRKLRLINETVNSAIATPLGHLDINISRKKYDYEVILLSDSVAISVTRVDGENSKSSVLLKIAQIVQEIVDLYIREEPHLLLRGCITYGNHITDKSFIVGPAVDATAQFIDSAEGAFIWYLPPAT